MLLSELCLRDLNQFALLVIVEVHYALCEGAIFLHHMLSHVLYLLWCICKDEARLKTCGDMSYVAVLKLLKLPWPSKVLLLLLDFLGLLISQSEVVILTIARFAE